jgi:hypothetical protein
MEELIPAIILEEEEDDDDDNDDELLVYCMSEGATHILKKRFTIPLQFDMKVLMDSEIRFRKIFRGCRDISVSS